MANPQEAAGGWIPDQDQIERMAFCAGEETDPVNYFVQLRLIEAAAEVEWAGTIGTSTLERTVEHYGTLVERDSERLMSLADSLHPSIKQAYLDNGFSDVEAGNMADVEVQADINLFFAREEMRARGILREDE